MTLNDYIGRPKKNWTNKQWLQEAWIQVHNPWISEEDKLFWKEQIKVRSGWLKECNLSCFGV